MREYNQISYDERVKMAQLLQSKTASISQIAKMLGRSKSTISREIKRNQATPGTYWPDTAQSLALKRRARSCIIDRNPLLKEFIVDHLCCHYWTPEQIAAALKFRQKLLPSVSHETIYKWIYSPGQRIDKLWNFLPRHKAKRGLRKYKGAGVNRIPQRISIHERPKSIEKKRELGHWEGDLMSFQKNSQHIVVLRERKTMFTLSCPLPSKNAESTALIIINLLKGLPKESLRSLTFDNGGEFANHFKIQDVLGIKTYFCDPYASWQKGGVENTNGRLRRDLPRKINIHKIKKDDFDETIENYNMTPRKNLGWLTPLEAFYKNLNHVALCS